MRKITIIIVILLVAFIPVFVLKLIHKESASITISHFPDGKDFGFSIIDDTDYSYGPEIEPVYELLDSLGMKTTKTVWVFNQKHSGTYRKENEKNSGFENSGASLENPTYFQLVKKLHERGFEIALHGVSAGNDYRNEIISGYEMFRNIFGDYPKMDILHATNIENLYSGHYKLDNPILKFVEKLIHKSQYQGHIPGSDYFWGDISKEKIKYVRLPFHAIKEINLLKLNPAMPFHDPIRPYVNFWFPNSDGSDYVDFMKLTSKKNIDRLQKERGITIIYTHFANQFAKKKGNSYELKEDFIERMKYIASLNGWFVPATKILDRLLMIKALQLIDDGDTVVVINKGDEDIHGLTLICKKIGQLYDSKDRVLYANNEGKIIIDVLPSRSTLTLFKKKRCSTEVSKIIRLQRFKIELSNYIGEFIGL